MSRFVGEGKRTSEPGPPPELPGAIERLTVTFRELTGKRDRLEGDVEKLRRRGGPRKPLLCPARPAGRRAFRTGRPPPAGAGVKAGMSVPPMTVIPPGRLGGQVGCTPSSRWGVCESCSRWGQGAACRVQKTTTSAPVGRWSW